MSVEENYTENYKTICRMNTLKEDFPAPQSWRNIHYKQ